VNLVVFPAALHVRHEDGARLPRLLDESLRLVAALLGLFVVGACLLSRWGVALIAGAAHVDAAHVLPLIVLGYCGLTLIQFLRLVPMVVERRTAGVAGSYLAIALATVLLDLVLIPRAGTTGAALAGLSAQAAGVILIGEVGRRSLPAWRWWRPLTGPFAATVLVAPAALLFSVPGAASFPRAILSAALWIAGYGAAARLTGALTGQDLRWLSTLWASARNRVRTP
jgi:O-antigen/teichoic acid export membrane protein